MITNFALVSAQLREPGGPLVWALGTNGNEQLQGALTNVNSLLANTDTNVAALLINLADITSNLNAQVQANSNILSSISKIVVDTDDFVQGLKRHWLLRSAFKRKSRRPRPTRRRRNRCARRGCGEQERRFPNRREAAEFSRGAPNRSSALRFS